MLDRSEVMEARQGRRSAFKIVWVKSYFVAIDELLALPVWRESPGLAKAMASKHHLLEIVSERRAREINDAAIARNSYTEAYFDDLLAQRLAMIEQQRIDFLAQ